MITPVLSLDRVQKSRPYAPAFFVNRDDELLEIDKKVEQLQAGGTVPDPIVNFWGVGGIGKTWLLQHLYHRYRYQAEPSIGLPSLKRSTFALLYTFSDEPRTTSLTQAVKELGAQALSQLPSSVSNEDHALLVRASETGNVEALLRSLAKLSTRFVLLLLLDAADTVPASVWEELETQLIEPVVLGGNALVIVAGRRQVPRWRRFEVRRRVMEPEKSHLRAFDRQAVINQINKLDYRIPIDLLLPYTAGNPLLVEAIAWHIRAWTPQDKKPDQASLNQHRGDLLQILSAYEQQLLEHVPSDLKPVLYAVSPLRFYRLESLRFMLTKQSPEAGSRSEFYYLNTLRALDREIEVVWWDRECRAYATSETVRKVINRRWLLEDGKNYTARHGSALEMYWDWASDYAEASEDSILEIWFHLASVYLATGDLDQLRREAMEALSFAGEHLSSGHLLILQKQLEGDKELRDLLPEALFDELSQSLEQSVESKAQ
jgi:hypothetical protein